ncbi:hypothetical protein C6P46_006233 [Rhodotorula mucilaginosa]|uniref:Enoyl-CoA hydratase n=1 Tax=Rhodotorula mucilaginosa TaxID=5537 RepID=A0A9P7B4A8_RHOMI|nr:hypothetical protein C6P46_006233 [Rhodotorula mucilaginosa]
MRPPTPSFLLIKKPSPRPCDIDRLDGGLAVSSSDSTLATRRHTCLPSSSSFTLQKRLKFPGRRGGTSLAGIETPLLHGRVPLLRRAVRETKVRLMAYHFGLMRRSAVGLPPVRDRAGEGSALDGRKICSSLRATTRTGAAALRFPRLEPLVRFQSSTAAASPDYTSILVSQPAEGVSQITLNRPKALNGPLPSPFRLSSPPCEDSDLPTLHTALNSTLFHELNAALRSFSTDDSVRCVVLTGSEKAFAAGADIKEMKDKQFAEVYKGDFLAHWTELSQFRKPIVAAVSGYALGGGCELAMMCDIILASPTALGVIPGAGGTQRLTHAIGKSRAMELVLTGGNLSAQQASEWGLVSRVVEQGSVVDEAVKVAGKIAGKGMLAVQAGKEGVNAAYEMSLANGLHFERRLFHQLFATNDQKEGMGAFANKQKAKWTHS